jgi:UDP-N-acetylglucosamine diphosphorylase / glucose-1-phosphate thymidylyltransferase / UDP-N-acetylgalactosamine diphosphorylase / glucosamine-1-phosphate N-acetyltransferase / galactosamine-1-phosphate N-acetyltransferase
MASHRQSAAAPSVDIATYITSFGASPLAPWLHLPAWQLVAQAPDIVRRIVDSLPASGYAIADGVAVHASATVESGAVLKGPLFIGPGCFVAAGAYLRGGAWLAEHCTIGPGAELKSSFLFGGTKLAHFNFVGDSVLGAGVNLEAGSIVCNYRNERDDREVRVRIGARLVRTGQDKFGALIGDGCRIGANAVLAPGVLLRAGSVVGRAQLLDQEAAPRGAP